MSNKNRIHAEFKNPTFTIIGDGETEKWYFDMLQRTEKDLNIVISPRLTVKKTLEEQFKNVISESEKRKIYKKDQVFWIIDFDTILSETREAKKGKKPASQEFKEYYEKLKKRDNVKIIINNPCLEFWFLLHFKEIGRFFNNCDDAKKELQKHLTDYKKDEKYFKKQNNDIYLRLKPHRNTALVNAKKLLEFNFEYPNKSVSEMYVLFETLFPETNKNKRD